MVRSVDTAPRIRKLSADHTAIAHGITGVVASTDVLAWERVLLDTYTG
jgi:hypothetical protein